MLLHPFEGETLIIETGIRSAIRLQRWPGKPPERTQLLPVSTNARLRRPDLPCS